MDGQKTLTYGQLRKKLKAFGFVEYSVELDGKRGRVFEHEGVRATIMLPQRKDEEPVEAFYLNSVLMTLKSRGLVRESNPLLA